ncbi:MAG TPA: Vms1/Ankzf1 family peptidyl-tRNA hydrolase [Solirubrobacteraceae bacterium]|nr:Vms1/Ankzf1 family peptidyl-tRNA hydrolase [Solirubrobacteraceae bacterium]
MAATTTSSGRVRRLAELRPETGRVLSIYLDLDPSEFGTAPARATAITSALDEAGRTIDAMEGLEHDERVALREDVDRVRAALDPQTLAAGGARALAVFACGPANLLEVVKLPHPVEGRVVVDRAPFVDPLARAGEQERWCVVLVSRQTGRILLGDEHGLEEVDRIQDDTKGQHQQGGWSQRRYEETIENEKRDHLDHVVDELMTLLRRRPFDRLLVGGPEPIDSELENRLHPYLAERLSGRVQVDVENTNADDVLAAAAPVFAEQRAEHEREAVERLRAGLGRDGGRAVAGLADTLAALNEQRVEVLLLEPGVSKRGWHDPETGMLAAEPGASPTGGTLDELEDVVEAAVEKAVEQSAEVLVLRDQPDLGPHGGIAALLRF